MNLSSLSISKTLGGLVNNPSNDFSILMVLYMNNHFREQGKVVGGGDQRLPFNHEYLQSTHFSNKAGKFCVLKRLEGDIN